MKYLILLILFLGCRDKVYEHKSLILVGKERGHTDSVITKWMDAKNATRDTMVIIPCDSTKTNKDSVITLQ